MEQGGEQGRNKETTKGMEGKRGIRCNIIKGLEIKASAGKKRRARDVE